MDLKLTKINPKINPMAPLDRQFSKESNRR